MKLRIACFIFSFILCMASLTGCEEWLLGDGRGDIKIQLKDEYYIFEVNSADIVFCKKKPSGGYENIIERYFISMYGVYGSYITLGGIHYESYPMSDAEREDGAIEYYLFNTETEELDGPYYNEEVFETYCMTKGFAVKNNWLFVCDYD